MKLIKETYKTISYSYDYKQGITFVYSKGKFYMLDYNDNLECSLTSDDHFQDKEMVTAIKKFKQAVYMELNEDERRMLMYDDMDLFTNHNLNMLSKKSRDWLKSNMDSGAYSWKDRRTDSTIMRRGA